MINIISVLILASMSCSLLGVFIVLRKNAMLIDAIGHTVLLGIVLAYMLVRDLDSPFLIIGATLIGMLTVILVEMLGNSKLVKSSDAIGVIYPILLSIAVIIISKYFKSTHLDTDIVLSGEVVFSSLSTIDIFGLSIPKPIIKSLILLLVILSFIKIFYREIKISIFDNQYAKLIGIPVGIIFYTIMCLTSLTAVVSFDIFGSILVISFFVAPAATALLFSKDLTKCLILSVVFATISSIVGGLIAILYNLSISGMCALINMIIYFSGIMYTSSRKK